MLIQEFLLREHISEETLDFYAFDRLPERDAGGVEEHLLVCIHCQAELELIDLIIQVNRGLERDAQTVPLRAVHTTDGHPAR